MSTDPSTLNNRKLPTLMEGRPLPTFPKVQNIEENIHEI